MKEDEKENGGLLALPNGTRGSGRFLCSKQEQMPVRGVLLARKKKTRGAKDARMVLSSEEKKERASQGGKDVVRSVAWSWARRRVVL